MGIEHRLENLERVLAGIGGVAAATAVDSEWGRWWMLVVFWKAQIELVHAWIFGQGGIVVVTDNYHGGGGLSGEVVCLVVPRKFEGVK